MKKIPLFDKEVDSRSSGETLFARRKAAVWMSRLLASSIPLSDTFYSCAAWIGGGLKDLAQRMCTGIKAPAGRTRVAIQARGLLNDLKTANPRRLDDYLESLSNDSDLLLPQIKDVLYKYFEETAALPGPRSEILQTRLHRLFGLDAKAADYCFFIFSLGQYEVIERYFEDELEINRFCNRHLLGRMLGISGAEALDLHYSLSSMGLLESSHHNMLRISERVERALLANSGRNLQALFCRPLPKTSLEMEQFHMDEDAKRHALVLMADKTSRPVHLLLYGAPGSGKTSFASALAQKLGVKAWGVECHANDTSQDRRASLAASLKVAAQHEGSFVLVDEAERLLDTENGDIEEGSAKPWVNSLLERKNTHIIWITNKVRHLDNAVRRRFSYSIFFQDPGEAESLAMWNSVAARIGVADQLPEETRKKFARLYPVPVATMDMALRQAKAHAGKKEFIAWVERVLSAQVTLRNNGLPCRPKPGSKGDYDPDAVCASTPVSGFLEKFDKLVKKLQEDPQPGRGTMLFYGPPGTGKTALAKHLAVKTGRELLIRRASDLLGPYVGETEEKIASAFAEAETKKALLLIDEADSFLFGRAGAVHSWEQTMVNEFLMQLESFQGVCICTTNFRKHLDPAAMRRFSLKMEFRYAGADQIRRLYHAILEPLAGTPLPGELERTLCAQKYLAPGDFNAVKLKMWLEDKPDHPELVNALIKEQKLKLENETKQVGF